MSLETNPECRVERQKDIAVARAFYQVTEKGSPRGTVFPIPEVPWLNQTVTDISGYYSFDDFEAGWIAGFTAWQTITDKVDAGLSEAFKTAPYESSQEFQAVRNGFNAAIKVTIISLFYESLAKWFI